MPSPTEPRPMATFAHAAPLDWMPCSASLASTCLSISELILSTSPSATAPSYARPSSVCTAAAAATSSCARSSIKPSYIAIDRPDNELCCRPRWRRLPTTGRPGHGVRPGCDDRLSRLQCEVHGVPATDGATPRPCLREGGIAEARPQDGQNAVVVRGSRDVGVQPATALGLQHRAGCREQADGPLGAVLLPGHPGQVLEVVGDAGEVSGLIRDRQSLPQKSCRSRQLACGLAGERQVVERDEDRDPVR